MSSEDRFWKQPAHPGPQTPLLLSHLEAQDSLYFQSSRWRKEADGLVEGHLVWPRLSACVVPGTKGSVSEAFSHPIL